jgi:hypothetical protein
MSENTKHQDPNTKEVPMTNDQIPRKLQLPSSNGASGGAVGWDLALGIFFGAWALGIGNSQSTDH